MRQKWGWATFWAIFFTNKSGHPDYSSGHFCLVSLFGQRFLFGMLFFSFFRRKGEAGRVTRLHEFSPIGWLFSLGSFFLITEVCSPNLWATFSLGKSYAVILTKRWVGLHFGRFVFTISSGHPGSRRVCLTDLALWSCLTKIPNSKFAPISRIFGRFKIWQKCDLKTWKKNFFATSDDRELFLLWHIKHIN
jgi:hypothetical protein